MATFNPDKVAYAEANSWRAYYDHDWFKLLRLVVTMMQEQFNIPFPLSIVAAYYTVRASAAWAPKDHDEAVVQRYLEKFYRMARRYSGRAFDPQRAAQLEVRYWAVHRELSGKPDKTEFIQVMTDLHSEIFGIPREQARESGELRVLANSTVDLITSKTSTDPEADWKKLEDYLRECYRSIAGALPS
jgi:hypothetical protein